MKYKVLSLWQPWASLLVMGHKLIETRGWDTSHRGPLLIHAAVSKDYKKVPADDAMYRHYHSLFARGLMPPIEQLPFGAIIGAVNVTATISTNRLRPGLYDKTHAHIING